jgi:hypothetical protein
VAESSDTSPQNTDQSADQAAPKKPYSKPHLEVYGDLRKITGRLAGHGSRDGVFIGRTHA